MHLKSSLQQITPKLRLIILLSLLGFGVCAATGVYAYSQHLSGIPQKTDTKTSSDKPSTIDDAATSRDEKIAVSDKTHTADSSKKTEAKANDKKKTTKSDTKSSKSSGAPSKSDTPTAPAKPPVVTPIPTAPINPPRSPSGQTVPRANIGHWKHIFYDDFTKNAALGSWGEDWNPHKVVYTGAQGQQWLAYPKSYVDTYDKRPYRSDAVLSVRDGILNFYLHNVDGQPAGANPSPLISDGSMYQTYGRYSARFKVDSSNLSEYYVAWLLWPQSEVWPDDGEIDFPEGHLNGSVSGFHHYAGAGSYGGCRPNCQEQANVPANVKFTDWHTYTIEWSPGRIKMIVDDTVVLNSTNHVPSGPMRWQLQTETKGNGTNKGNLMLDWVSVWSYSP